MNILDKIVAHKIQEVEKRKELFPLKLLEQSIYFNTPVVSLSAYLSRADRVGIIAEIKRKSPSKGLFKADLSVERLSIGYMQAGASALSVLTDQEFFGGSNEDLTIARRFNYCPILRKDFVIDEYQIVEAKSIGADAVLLIARILSPEQIVKFAESAARLGLEVLLEVHGAEELSKAPLEKVDLVGVNNRNLDTFQVNVGLSLELAGQIPPSCIKVSESGLSSAQTLVELKEAGYKGFLIGEAFMTQGSPERACARLIENFHNLMNGK